MYAPAPDERALIFHHQIIQHGRQSLGKALSHQFTETVYEAYGPVVSDLQRVIFLPQQYHEGVIEVIKASSIFGPERVQSNQDVVLDNFPSLLVEQASESVRTRCLVTWQLNNDGSNLFLGE